MVVRTSSCQEKCPFLTTKDLKTHNCISMSASFKKLGFSSILLIISLIVTSLVTLVSRVITNKKDLPAEIFLSLFVQFEFINRICFLITLWPTTYYLKFCVTGVCLMLNVLLGCYFCEIVLKPVFYAIIKHRPQLEAKCRDSDHDSVVSSEQLMQ